MTRSPAEKLALDVREAFNSYEDALRRNDIDAMTAYFSASPDVVRFGISDMQHGPDELRVWRSAQPPLPPGRRLQDTAVLMTGADSAVITTLFDYPGRPMLGRQTQVWVRHDGRWRIISAHVSEVPA